MEQLWAPWRMEYILKEKEEGCVLCIPKEHHEDQKRLILLRSSLSFLILNLYPYNDGHLMAAPYRHVARIQDLEDEEFCDLMYTTRRGVTILEQAISPHGFNLGLNQGTPAGAGIADHIHLHIVPRWNADTNFMPVLTQTKVLNEALLTTYEKLKASLASVPEQKSGSILP